MLVADGRLADARDGGYEPAGELGELAVPDTLHALIAARLDAPRRRRTGRCSRTPRSSASRSRSTALAAVSGIDEPDARAAARARSSARELLRARDRPTFAGARPVRVRPGAHPRGRLLDARRCATAARATSPPPATSSRIGDDELAGALAGHYLAAYEASTEGPEAEALAAQARIALRAAADRAVALGAPGQAVDLPRAGDRGHGHRRRQGRPA